MRVKRTANTDSLLRIQEMKMLKRAADSYSHFGEDYLLTHFTTPVPEMFAPLPRHYEGITIVLLVKGTAHLMIDEQPITVPPMSALFIPPDMVFRPVSYDGDEIDCYVMFVSNRFTSEINIDLNAIDTRVFIATDPVLPLTPDRAQLLLRYFDLLHLNAITHSNYSKSIARALASAVAYLILGYGEELAEQTNGAQPHSRRMTYARTFLKLVRDNYRQERSLGFYADKMFVSPKYLSNVIKEATGKSAAEWIDTYVVQEAKNLLRYSGKNVQQIAYELSFNNQSSFGKYFKHLTGMSPTQFQNI